MDWDTVTKLKLSIYNIFNDTILGNPHYHICSIVKYLMRHEVKDLNFWEGVSIHARMYSVE